MAVSKKAKTMIIKLLSTAGTGYFYTTTRPRLAPYKLALRKYDPVVRQHVLFKEAKLK